MMSEVGQSSRTIPCISPAMIITCMPWMPEMASSSGNMPPALGFPENRRSLRAICYIGSEDKYLHAVSRRTGSRVWQYAGDGPFRSSPTISQGHVFIGSDDGFLHAVNLNTRPAGLAGRCWRLCAVYSAGYQRLYLYRLPNPTKCSASILAVIQNGVSGPNEQSPPRPLSRMM